MVNLRPETDPETEYVAFDRPRVLRVLARIIADLLAGYPPIAAEEQPEIRTPRPGQPATGDGWRSPTHPPERLSAREERAALWAALGLPPHERRSSPTPRKSGSGPSRLGVVSERVR